MTGFLTVAIVAFVLGIRHATDADHIIATTAIVTRHRSLSGAAAIGLAWGVGHTLTILVVGGGIILLGWVIPESVGLSMELAVGVMLIILGLTNLRGVVDRTRWLATAPAPEPELAPRTHRHGDYVHTHAHVGASGRHPHPEDATPVARLDRAFGALKAYQLVRPLLVGVVHGLAGSAAVTLLVLATIPSPGWSMAYLLIFGAGTILGMMAFTVAISLPLLHPRVGSANLAGRLRAAAGILSLGFGLFLVYDVGVVQGLFGLA